MAAQGEPKMSEREDPDEELDLQLTEENESELHLPSGHRTSDSEESDGSSTSPGRQCQCVFRQTLLPEPDQKFMTMCQEHFHLMMQQEPQQQPTGQQQATGVQLPPDVQLQASMVSTVVGLLVYLEGPAHDPQHSNSNESKAHFEPICCDSTVFQPAEGTVGENDILHPIAPVSPTGHPQHVGFLHTAQSFNAPSADDNAAPAGGFTPRAAEMVSVEEITEAAAYQTVGVAEAIKVSDTAGANDAEIITGEVINQLVAKAQVAESSAVEQVERVIKAADIINTALENMVEASNAAKSLVLEVKILAKEATAEAERLIVVAEATEGEAAAAQEAVVKTAGAAMVEGADTAAVEGSSKAALYTSAARATKKAAIAVQLQTLALVIAEATKAEVKTFEAILKCVEIQVERATKYGKNTERARVAIASLGAGDEMTTEIEEITTEVAYLNACCAADAAVAVILSHLNRNFGPTSQTCDK